MMQNCAIDLLQMDLRLHSGIPSQLHGRFDVVLTNPPFGTKNSQGLF
jgi:predicted RNA methylase